MNHDAMAAIKRQVPFLIGGTITGIIMTYFFGFPITLLVNSTMWYLISLMVYKLVWRKNGLTDQMILLRYILKKIKRQKKYNECRDQLLLWLEILYDTGFQLLVGLLIFRILLGPSVLTILKFVNQKLLPPNDEQETTQTQLMGLLRSRPVS